MAGEKIKIKLTIEIKKMRNKKLIHWLTIEFLRSNHSRYHKYVEDWIKNLTNDQLIGFEKQMIRLENHL